MSVTIEDLLEFGGKSLRLVPPSPDLSEQENFLDREINWIHSSELLDPSPFLSPGQLLLTDGSQFSLEGEDPSVYENYVQRLVQRGIVGLGFGTGLVHDQAPRELINACHNHQLVLFTVEDLTPFLAFIRFVADEEATARVARARWFTDAHRALSRAALRPGGLTSILDELERHLECRAFLFDAGGNPILETSPDRTTGGRTMQAAVHEVLQKGRPSATQILVNDQSYSVRTLGQGSSIYGALVLSETNSLHPDASELVNSVLALATLALTQNRALALAQRHLRAGIFEQLLSGSHELAVRTARTIWGDFPSFPTTVIALAKPQRVDFLADSLERLSIESRGKIFFAQWEDKIIVVPDRSQTSHVWNLAETHHIPLGTSNATVETFARSVDEAVQAMLQGVDSGRPRMSFEDLREDGMLGLLRNPRGEALARSLVDKLADYDEEAGTELLRTLHVWFENDCAWGQTATLLGIHRHTLRHRISAVERVLNIDLDSMRGRMELWAAINLDRRLASSAN